jgi:hypothetical protein
MSDLPSTAGDHVTISDFCLEDPPQPTSKPVTTQQLLPPPVGEGSGLEAPPGRAQTGRRAKPRGGERPPVTPPMTVAEARNQDLGRILLTREQAARRCGVSLNKLDEWSYEPGFPVLREGGHFVKIHARLLDEWLAQRAQMNNRPQPYQAIKRSSSKR